MSTVIVRLSGVGSVFPATSIARTSKVWEPSASEAVVFGEVHDDQTPPSTRHSKVEPASLEENAYVGVESLVKPDGPLSIVVTGGTVSASPAYVMTPG